jgi:putative glutamine amidotransferase
MSSGASRPDSAGRPDSAARPGSAGPGPRIVVTLSAAGDPAAPDLAARKRALYLAALARHGATTIPLDAAASDAERAELFRTMDGLLLAGGADLDPSRYGEPNVGSWALEPDRDELEAAAWAAAEARAVPVLGICRGLQAMNVFAGGQLLQHVEGHAGPPWGEGPAPTHPLRVVPGTRLARILYPTNVGGVLRVNSFHHQAVRPADLAPRFIPSAFAPSPSGDLVEAFEAGGGPFRVAVQCHPERIESTPRVFERLFAFFVDACRGPVADRGR